MTDRESMAALAQAFGGVEPDDEPCPTGIKLASMLQRMQEMAAHYDRRFQPGDWVTPLKGSPYRYPDHPRLVIKHETTPAPVSTECGHYKEDRNLYMLSALPDGDGGWRFAYFWGESQYFVPYTPPVVQEDGSIDPVDAI